MTGTANEGKSLACQGLHNAPVLAYVSTRTVQSDRRLSPFAMGLLPPRREDECIGC
jgi:hypothetical protein